LTRASVIRAGLAALAVVELALGAWQLFAPHSFYVSFPTGQGWVQALGPYDAHLMTDVGELTLALGALLGFAAVVFERRLVQVALVVYLVPAVPHLVFHAVHRDGLSAADNAGNLGTLGLAVLVPALLLWLTADWEPA
jgi:hypothetical protein